MIRKLSMVAGLLLVGALCLAQDTGGGNTGGGRRTRGQGGQGGPGGGGFDANQVRAQMADRMKTALGATDDEWNVLKPKVEKVQQLQRDMRGGGMGMGGMFGRGGRGGPAGGGTAPEPTTEVGKASQALAKVLENKDSTADQIKTALTALRDAKTKAKTELEKAQKELKEILTVRQEAQLVQMGVLE